MELTDYEINKLIEMGVILPANLYSSDLSLTLIYNNRYKTLESNLFKNGASSVNSMESVYKFFGFINNILDFYGCPRDEFYKRYCFSLTSNEYVRKLINSCFDDRFECQKKNLRKFIICYLGALTSKLHEQKDNLRACIYESFTEPLKMHLELKDDYQELFNILNRIYFPDPDDLEPVLN